MLKIEKFSKSYLKDIKVIDNLNLTIDNGDIYGIVGHNGAGKSTLLRSIVGCLDFDNGEIFIDEKSIKKNPLEYKKQIAYVPDNPDIYNFLTGTQYLNFIADIYNMSILERNKQIENYSEIFKMSGFLDNLISSYSKGMKQKIIIIGALIHYPKVIILDEPFSALDPESVYNLKKIMKEFCAKGNSIIFSSHILELTEQLCNKIAIIKNGKIVINGYTSEILGDKTLESKFMEGISNE